MESCFKSWSLQKTSHIGAQRLLRSERTQKVQQKRPMKAFCTQRPRHKGSCQLSSAHARGGGGWGVLAEAGLRLFFLEKCWEDAGEQHAFRPSSQHSEWLQMLEAALFSVMRHGLERRLAPHTPLYEQDRHPCLQETHHKLPECRKEEQHPLERKSPKY